MSKFLEIVLAGIIVLLAIAIGLSLQGLVWYCVWNYLIALVFSVKTISFGQAILLSLAIRAIGLAFSRGAK